MSAKEGRKNSSESEGKGGGLLASNLTWAEWRQVRAVGAAACQTALDGSSAVQLHRYTNLV